jgi:hypothetical protein
MTDVLRSLVVMRNAGIRFKELALKKGWREVNGRWQYEHAGPVCNVDLVSLNEVAWVEVGKEYDDKQAAFIQLQLECAQELFGELPYAIAAEMKEYDDLYNGLGDDEVELKKEYETQIVRRLARLSFLHSIASKIEVDENFLGGNFPMLYGILRMKFVS